MESPDDVRASLTVLAVAELVHHEDTSPAGEARVARLLAEAGAFSWPLVVDGASGLILDGSHRARVLRREHGARHVVVQRVALDHPGVTVRAWCRVLEGVEPTAFLAAAGRLGLEAGAPGSVACHFEGEVYGRPGLTPAAAYELARSLLAALGGNGHGPPLRFADEDEVGADLHAPGTVVLRLPALDKATIRAHAGSGRLPPKSTRFILPYRVFGLGLPLRALAGSRAALEERLAAERALPLVCLGDGLAVDRRYPERLWQLAGYRIPPTLFVAERDRLAYETARARAASTIA